MVKGDDIVEGCPAGHCDEVAADGQQDKSHIGVERQGRASVDTIPTPHEKVLLLGIETEKRARTWRWRR